MIEMNIIKFNYKKIEYLKLSSILNKEKNIEEKDFLFFKEIKGISYDIFFEQIQKSINVNHSFLRLEQNTIYIEDIALSKKEIFYNIDINKLDKYTYNVIELNNKFKIITSIYESNKEIINFSKIDFEERENKSKLIYTSNYGFPILNIFMENNILSNSFEELILLFSKIQTNNLKFKLTMSEDQILDIYLKKDISLDNLLLNESLFKKYLSTIFKQENAIKFGNLLKINFKDILLNINGIDIDFLIYINSKENLFNEDNLNANYFELSFIFFKKEEISLINIYEFMIILNSFFFNSSFKVKNKILTLNEFNFISILEAD